jgi:cell division septal protein FtsQ
VKRNLELVSVIDSVSVERVLPRTLKIRVTEREPVAQVNVPRAGAAGGILVRVSTRRGRLCHAAAGSAAVRDSAGADERSVAGDHGLECVSIAAGPRVESPQVQAALQLIGAFNHSPMAGLVDLRRIDVSSPGVVVATTGQGSEITFGLDNLDQQLRRWREIYDLGQRMNKAIASADLAVSNNVPVRWMAASAAPGAA